MKVQIDPTRSVDGAPLQVRHPITGHPFPAGSFELSAADLANPDIRRLLPRSHGGTFGDLVPFLSETTAPAVAKTKGSAA